MVEKVVSSTNVSDPSLFCVTLEKKGYIGTITYGNFTFQKQGSVMFNDMKGFWEVNIKWPKGSWVRVSNTLTNILRLMAWKQDTETCQLFFKRGSTVWDLQHLPRGINRGRPKER